MLLLGIGLLATGKMWAGLSVLVIGTLAMAVVLSPTKAGKIFFVALGLLLGSGGLAFQAASNEITGKATYYHPGVGRNFVRSESVTKETSPAKFRDASNLLWGGSILGLLAGVAFLRLSRKLDDCTDDF